MTMRGRPMARVPILLLSVATASFALAACGSSASEAEGAASQSPAQAESTAAPSEMESAAAETPLKLAFFSVGSNNTYLQSGIKGAQDAAAKYGATIEVFDGSFDGAKQLNQVTQAISGGDFNGFVLEPNNSQQLCSAVEEAVAAGIKIGITNVPACDAPYDGVYAGTEIFVGGQGPDVYKSWFEQGLADPEGGEFAVLNGPATQGNTVRAREVLDAVKGSFPNWEEVGFLYTDYQSDKALAQTQTLLQQYPNLKAIFSSYSGQTPGAISAIKAAGKEGQVKVYDLGGDQVMFDALKNDEITSTLVYLPYEEQYRAVQAVVAALQGKTELDGVKVGQFWDLTKDPKLNGLPAFVENSRIDEYLAIGLPEY